MESLFLLTTYDNRWLFFGLLQRNGYFDLHQDVTLSDTTYFLAYVQLQLLGICLMTLGENGPKVFADIYHSIMGDLEVKDPFSMESLTNPMGDDKDQYYFEIEALGFKIKEIAAISYLHLIKIALLFAMGVKIRYNEQKWKK